MSYSAALHVDEFFELMARQGIAISYSDIRLATHHSEVLPHETCVESRFSRNVSLKTPIVSAAMDSVTEQGMAIEMALHGGLGIIHYNLAPEEQARQVSRVKRRMNNKIETPETVRGNATVGQVLEWIRDRKLNFHTFPVINSRKEFVGVVTKNDFDFCDEPSTKIARIMTRATEVVHGNPDTTADEAYQLMIANRVKMIPIIEQNSVTGLYIHSDLKRLITDEKTAFNLDSQGRLRVGAAIGTGSKGLHRAELLVKAGVDVLVINTAHADTKDVLAMLETLKLQFPHMDVVAGNVSEYESAQTLAAAGADGILVGQGPGAICTTRIVAGVGCPQATAVYQCARAVKDSGTNIPVCADGGINNSGDITIALAIRGDSVMLGSLLAGTEEAPSEKIQIAGSWYKRYRGMGSLGAMKERDSSKERYLQSSNTPLVPEGVEGLVPYIGTVSEALAQYVGGLRKGMGYLGARTICALRENSKLFRLTEAGLKESHPHNLDRMQEAPNYRRA